MNDTQRLRYGPLPSGEASFRLLRVLPSLSQNATIQCEMEVVTIASSVKQYVAGSYVWGPPKPVSTLLVNGVEVRVRENLVHFLRACRDNCQVFNIWIDAICINQEDSTERSSQIATMSLIYANAKAVYCWLGASPRVAAVARSCSSETDNALWEGDGNERAIDSALATIVRCEYWTRLWIVQEFVLAQEIFLLAGPNKVPFEAIDYMIWRVEEVGLKQWKKTTDSNAMRVLELRRMRSNQEYRRFEQLFLAFSAMGCSLPRDRLFALTGMLAPEELAILRPLIDYEMPIWDILLHLLRSDLIQNPAVFMQAFTTHVIQNQDHYTMTNRVDVSVVSYLHIPQKSSQWSPRNLWHQSASTDRRVFSPSSYFPRGVSTYNEFDPPEHHSYELLKLAHMDHHKQRLYVCALVYACAECSHDCQGHAMVGLALILSELLPDADERKLLIGRSTLFAAYTFDADFGHGAHLHVLAPTLMEAIPTFQHSIEATKTSGPFYSLETDLETFMRLSHIVVELGRLFWFNPKAFIPTPIREFAVRENKRVPTAIAG